MMTRTQISMEPAMLRRAKDKATGMGVSLAEYVRGLIRRDLGGERPGEDVSGVFDLGDSGGSDVAGHKDRMLAEAMEGERRAP